MIASLELDQYHELCYWHLRRTQVFSVSPQTVVNMMTVVYQPWDSHLEGSVEIAARTNLDMGSFGWTGEAIGQPMDDGWTR